MSLASPTLKDCEIAAVEVAANYFIIGRDRKGRWVVRDRRGLNGGVFASFGSALHFAKGEAFAAGCGIIVSQMAVSLHLEF